MDAWLKQGKGGGRRDGGWVGSGACGAYFPERWRERGREEVGGVEIRVGGRVAVLVFVSVFSCVCF